MFARPEYGWVQHRDPLQWLRDLWDLLLGQLARQELAHPVWYKVIAVAAALVLIALLVHVAYIVWRITRSPTRRERSDAAVVFAEPRDARVHLARAEELARLGRYGEALAHRFLAVVLELDSLRALTFHPAKTPAEYVVEAQLDASGRASLADLVGRLYRHVFGAVPCDRDAYRAFGAVAQIVPLHVASR